MPTDKQLFSNWKAQFYGFGNYSSYEEYPVNDSNEDDNKDGEKIGTITYNSLEKKLEINLDKENK
jgi:hypothetical protein